MEENNNIEVKKAFEKGEDSRESSDSDSSRPVSARDSWHSRNEQSGKKNSRGKRSNIRALLIFAAILIGITILAFAVSVVSDFVADRDGQSSGAANIGEKFIGVLYIEGTIGQDDPAYNQEFNIDAVEGMMTNDNNKAMMLYVNTPGGGVYESDELYLKIREYQDKTKRPVYVYMASQATSGGYYISASADKIAANRNCWTGSIGVTLGTIFDVSGLLDEYGIKTNTITSGKNKAMGSITEPVSSEQKKIFQSLVDEAYDQFVGIVADGRNMDEADVKKLADGRIYTARQALKNGLIDKVVDSYELAEKDMIEEFDLEGCEIYDFRYEAEESIIDTLVQSIDKIADASAGESDIAALVELMDSDGSLPLKYMCEVRK